MNHTAAAGRTFVVLAIVTGVLYPALVTLCADIAAPWKADGSILRRRGFPAGSEHIGQRFDSMRYFHSRPSACAYGTLPAGAGNLARSNTALRDSLRARDLAFRRINSVAGSIPIPPEMLAASGSGVDPHCSPEAAILQVSRVAAARGWNAAHHQQLRELIRTFTEEPQYGIFGPERVNILKLNLALDTLQ